MREIATKEAVWAAAAALDVAGTPPTVLLLRERVGGSFSTIQKHLRSWQEAQVAKQVVVVPPEIEAQVDQLTTQLVHELWRVANQQHLAEIAQLRQQAHTDVARVEAERDAAYAEITRLEQELDRATESVTHLEQEIQAQSTRLTEAQAQIHSLQESLRHVQAQEHHQATRANAFEERVRLLEVEIEQAQTQRASQFTEAVTAIQQKLSEQAAQLQKLAEKNASGNSE